MEMFGILVETCFKLWWQAAFNDVQTCRRHQELFERQTAGWIGEGRKAKCALLRKQGLRNFLSWF